MSKCLRCGAGPEWLQGKIPDEPPIEPTTGALAKWSTEHHIAYLNWEKELAAEREKRRQMESRWSVANKQLREQLAAEIRRGTNALRELAAERGKQENTINAWGVRQHEMEQLREQLSAEREAKESAEANCDRLATEKHRKHQQIQQLREQLSVAVEALKKISRHCDGLVAKEWAEAALAKIGDRSKQGNKQHE